MPADGLVGVTAAAFDELGFALLPEILDADECSAIEPAPLPEGCVGGSRCLLPLAWRASLARRLQGELYVQPPRAVLEKLIALRLHVDPCGDADGPLRFVPGSHRKGIFDPASALAERAASGEVVCAATRGSVLAMRPLTLHASSKSTGQGRRRVIHFLFGPRDLPFGLEWPMVI